MAMTSFSRATSSNFPLPLLLQHLVDTGDKLLAEASPFDLVWGIDLRADDMRTFRSQRWRGPNLLGDILMKIRY